VGPLLQPGDFRRLHRKCELQRLCYPMDAADRDARHRTRCGRHHDDHPLPQRRLGARGRSTAVRVGTLERTKGNGERWIFHRSLSLCQLHFWRCRPQAATLLTLAFTDEETWTMLLSTP